MKVYVASSWRTESQPGVVGLLRSAGHQVYDFRFPSKEGPEGAPGCGFSWSEIDHEWQSWSPEQYREALNHGTAQRGFAADQAALDWCDACLLILPCGRSAHLELGYCAGKEKLTVVYIPDATGFEPELMYLLCDVILVGEEELQRWAGE